MVDGRIGRFGFSPARPSPADEVLGFLQHPLVPLTLLSEQRPTAVLTKSVNIHHGMEFLIVSFS
jgi:hypothetical protein